MHRAIWHSLLIAAMVATIAVHVSAEDLQPGLVGEYFSLSKGLGDADQPPNDAKPFYVRIDNQINFPEASQEFHGSKLADHFCVRWTGVLRVVKAGPYTFHTQSDDGSRLYINGQRVVDNWGPHSFS